MSSPTTAAPATLAAIGVTGLAVMGSNLARNLARHGHVVALHNRTALRTSALVDAFGSEGTFLPSDSVEGFVASLERPRRIIIMVKAGDSTDAVIDDLIPYLEPGDIILTGTPQGVGQAMDPPRFLASGDVVRLEVEGLGVLEHTVSIVG